MGRILLVEDDHELLQGLVSALSRTDEVLTATDIPAAMAALDKETLDLVLLDMILPSGTGFQVLDHLRGMAGNTPAVVVSSALAGEIDLSPYKGLVVDLLPKPYGLRTVEKTVRQVLAGHCARAEGPAAIPGASVLLVDDDPELRTGMADYLSRSGYQVTTAPGTEEALALMAQERFDIVVSDWIMPGTTGLQLLEKVRGAQPQLPFLLLTGHGTPDLARRALAAGASDVLLKPFPPKALPAAVDKCLRQAGERPRLPAATRRAAAAAVRYTLADISGDSPAIRQARQALERAAAIDSSVLIRGETGTGKELFAQALHSLSKRAGGPFVAVNAAAIPETLLESELFGYAPGAFTGARREGQPGKFVKAEGGTLFLDEIGDLPLMLQAKLLRVIQEGEVEVVGGATRQADVRIVAATHRNLEEMVAAGTFRSDLYYRLNVVTLDLPPLRDRADDVEVLARRFLAELCKRYGRRQAVFGDDALAALRQYPWPGNVRELANVVERAFAFAGGENVKAAHLPREIRPVEGPVSAPAPADQPLDLAQQERVAIVRALEKTGGNKAKAAKLLGISRAGLYIKLKVYDLQ
ncbi:MAG TPA: sigma 54-interacting transcriptional regulator [Symbiobacteriaceae bacterium]|nr:sigma 54-interacting transcriptional regulator [Symbiobacteriaceae bacterium]